MSQSGAAPQLGRETTVDALGKKWTIGRWTVDVWDELIDFAKKRLPDPWAPIKDLVQVLSPEEAGKLIQDTYKRVNAMFTIKSPEIQAFLDTPEGQMYLFWLLMRQHHPELTRQQAMDIAVEIGEAKQLEAFSKAAGSQLGGNVPAPAA